MTVIAMSRTEIERMSVLQDLAASRIKVTEAADADEPWSASGVSAGEGIRQAWTAGAGVTTAWQAEQPLLSDGFACRSDWPHSGALPGVPVANQIRTYWWCSPPRTGRQSMRPARSTARETGASFSKDRCVRTSL
jgi:hypothetical protein